jgi:hypothetical protein
MKQIPLSLQGKHGGNFYTLVSDIDSNLTLLRWFAVKKDGDRIYAARHLPKLISFRKEIIYLHDVIAQRIGLDTKSFQVDHRNNNSLDNQRHNLREATYSQNRCNRGKTCENQSGYKGVCWHEHTHKWKASIQIKGKSIYLGIYPEKADAARAYNDAAKKYHGEFAVLNDIKD